MARITSDLRLEGDTADRAFRRDSADRSASKPHREIDNERSQQNRRLGSAVFSGRHVVA
jgi:hypothetical protein